MKKVTRATILTLIFLGLGLAPLYAHQPGNHQQGMMNQQTGTMNGPQMSGKQMQKMQTAMKKMRATREKMLAAKTPAERQQLMREHLKAMEACMNLMFSENAMNQSRGNQDQMQRNQMKGGMGQGMVSSSQSQGMMKNRNRMMEGGGYQGMMAASSCGPMMQEMMKSIMAQMQMLMKK